MQLETHTIPLAGRREWFGLAILAFPTLLVSMDATVTFLALPALSASLHPNAEELLWITDMYTFTEAGFLIIMGALGDRIGRKRLLTWGLISFSAASVLAAFSTTPFMLIVARALLGITGAIILPCTLALIRNMFTDDKQRAMAFGIYTACYSGGTMLGPLIGGALLTYFWWGSVFLISVPLMVLFLLASHLLVDSRDELARRFSVADAMLLLAGTLPIIYAMKRTASSGSVAFEAATAFIAGSFFIYLFITRLKRSPEPLFDMHLFRVKGFTATLIMLFLSLFVWSGLYFYVAQYLQLVAEYTPMIAGLITLVPALITMTCCVTAPHMLRTFSKQSVFVSGGIIMVIGTLALSSMIISSTLWLVLLACSCLSAGCGLMVTIGIDLIVSSAPPQHSGAASGISETSTTFGTAFGIAILGSIGTAVYRAKLILPTSVQLPGDSASTLSSTLTSFRELFPPSVSMRLIISAREAFMFAFCVASLVGAALLSLSLITYVINARQH